MRYRKGTQKAFWQVAETDLQEPVRYRHPLSFAAGEEICRVHRKRLGLFLLRLSRTMTFDAYDRLTREVWVAHLRQPTQPAWPPPYKPRRPGEPPASPG
jgi:hypothetical protein